MIDRELPEQKPEVKPEAYDPSSRIAEALNLSPRQVSNTLLLLSDGATVPFIARYRKEMTGNLDEVQIRDVRDMAERLRELERRRNYILETIREQGLLDPALEQQ
ncbi:MAG: hypothetical protein IH599_01160, partial [Bacteroidales bacterium]|nr:hypothetical protein [Bacteroidales bacterium]